MHKFWAYPSSYVVLILWGTAGFGYQPSFSAFMVHFLLTPAMILFALWLAHGEGRREGRNHNHNYEDGTGQTRNF